VQVKLRIKLGGAEVEYEGSEDFLKTDLSSIIENLSLLPIASEVVPTTGSNDIRNGQSDSGASHNGSSNLHLSTNHIAAKLHCKTGPELVIAACAYLSLVLDRPTFSRAEILENMKTATSYYEETYRKNLTAILIRLVRDDKLIGRSANTYALHSRLRHELEVQLAPQ